VLLLLRRRVGDLDHSTVHLAVIQLLSLGSSPIVITPITSFLLNDPMNRDTETPPEKQKLNKSVLGETISFARIH
jgi:hypothetical protein